MSAPSARPVAPPAKNVRTHFEFRQAAQKYVDTQIAVMEKYGSLNTILPPEKYWVLVGEIQKIGENLWTSSGGTIR